MKNYVDLLDAAADAGAAIGELSDAIVELQNELAEERYRHDRYVDYSIAEGKRLESLLKLLDSLEDVASRSELVKSATILDVIATWRAMDDMSMRCSTRNKE